jgi:O-antigen ligase
LAIVFYGQVKAGLHVASLFGPGKTWETYSQMFNDAAFPYQLRTVFEETVSIHPTHASIFLGISRLIIINSLFLNFEKYSVRFKTLLFGLLILAVVMLAVLASRTPFMATMLAGLLLCFFHFKKKIYVVYAFGSVILLSISLIFLIPSFSERFREISFSNAQVPSENEENSFNLRTGIYKCSIHTIRKNWLWGVGPGNVQQSLNMCYDHISKEVYFEKNYNTHNQFLDYWAGLGIAGPVSLLLVFGWFISINYKTRNYLAISMALLFFLSMLTENLLTRQNGVVPFAFFIGLYFYSGSSLKKGKYIPINENQRA